jgi:hypothetical protein
MKSLLMAMAVCLMVVTGIAAQQPGELDASLAPREPNVQGELTQDFTQASPSDQAQLIDSGVVQSETLGMNSQTGVGDCVHYVPPMTDCASGTLMLMPVIYQQPYQQPIPAQGYHQPIIQPTPSFNSGCNNYGTPIFNYSGVPMQSSTPTPHLINSQFSTAGYSPGYSPMQDTPAPPQSVVSPVPAEGGQPNPSPASSDCAGCGNVSSGCPSCAPSYWAASSTCCCDPCCQPRRGFLRRRR